MVVTSGIGASVELTQVFSTATRLGNIRFIKITIQNESLVSVASVDATESLENDLTQLDAHLDDDGPSYILIRSDAPSSEWLVVSYVPDATPVRDKMLYASTRSSLTKFLGAHASTSTLFATSKEDVAETAYAAYKQRSAEPLPLDAKEQEKADIKIAERAEVVATLGGSRAKQSPLGHGKVGFQWTQEAEEAVKRLKHGEESHVVVLQVDRQAESVVLSIDANTKADTLATRIPGSEPSFSLFFWRHSYSTTGGDILFIHSCPSASPIKSRMLYSSGVLSTFKEVESLLEARGSLRKLQTSDPSELTETYLRQELGFGGGSSGTEKTAFARPKAPGRKR